MLQLISRHRPGALGQFFTHLRLPLFRNAYALIFNDGMTGLLGLCYWALAARYYTAEQVGRDAAVIATMMALAGLAYVNLKGTIMRLLPSAGRTAPRLIGYAYATSLTLALLIGGLFVVGYRWWTGTPGFWGDSPFSTGWFLAAIVGWSLFGLQDNILTGLRQTFWVPVENIGFGLTKILLLIACTAWWTERGVLLSWTAPVVLFIGLITLLIWRRLLPQHVQQSEQQHLALTPRQVLTFVTGDYVGTLLWMITTMALPLLVLNRAGAAANAYFYLAWTIAFPLHLVSSNMAVSLTVEGTRADVQVENYVQRSLRQIWRLLVGPVLLLQVGAPVLLQLFGNDYGAAGAWLLRLLALAALPYSVNAIFLGRARALNHMRAVVLTQGAICSLVLTGSYFLIQPYGLTGVGVAWLLSHSLVAGVLWVCTAAFGKERDQ